MTNAVSVVGVRAKRLLKIQFATGLVLAIVFLLIYGVFSSLSAFYGAAITIASTLVLKRNVRRADEFSISAPSKSMGVLYFGAVQRFVLVLALFIIGLGVLKLDAIAVMAGFILAQLGFLFNIRDRSN